MTRSRRWLAFAAMTLVALVLAHDIVFLLAYGSRYEEALAHAGHGDAWLGSALVVLTLAAGLLVAGLWRLRTLGILAGSASARSPTTSWTPPPGLDLRTVARPLGLEWLRLSLATSALLVVQENLERRQVGQPLPGLGVLGSPDYPFGIFVILVVALAVAFVGVLFRWRRDVLIARICAAKLGWPRSSQPATRRPVTYIPRREPVIGRSGALRAPPFLFDR